MTKLDEDELASLLRAAIAGDQKSYRQFLAAITPMIRGVINAKAAAIGRDDKEDILQEVLLAIHHKRASWQSDRPVKPWLYAIVRYKIIDLFRRRGARQFVDIDDFAHELAAEESEPTLAGDVDVMVSKLGGKPEAVVRKISLEGKTIAETAQLLDMKENAVRVNFHRGLEKLREMARLESEV